MDCRLLKIPVFNTSIVGNLLVNLDFKFNKRELDGVYGKMVLGLDLFQDFQLASCISNTKNVTNLHFSNEVDHLCL